MLLQVIEILLDLCFVFCLATVAFGFIRFVRGIVGSVRLRKEDTSFWTAMTFNNMLSHPEFYKTDAQRWIEMSISGFRMSFLGLVGALLTGIPLSLIWDFRSHI